MLIFSTPHPAPPYLRLEFFTIAFVSCFSNLFFGLIWGRPSVFLGQGFAFPLNVNTFLKVSSSRTSHVFAILHHKAAVTILCMQLPFFCTSWDLNFLKFLKLRWSLFSFSWSDPSIRGMVTLSCVSKHNEQRRHFYLLNANCSVWDCRRQNFGLHCFCLQERNSCLG